MSMRRHPVVVSAAYARRACLPAGRRVGLVLPAAGAVLFGLVAHAVTARTPEDAFAAVLSSGIFGIVVPIGCLVAGDAVLGAELRAGTLPFTWLSPVPRWTIVVGRWLAGTVVAAAVLGAAGALAALVAGVPGHAVAAAFSITVAAAAYIALFVMIGVVARRAVAWSLAAVVLGEILLGAALDGIAQLSPGWLGRAVFAGLTGARDLLRQGVPQGGAAVARSLLVTGAFLAVASWRLGHARLGGGSD